MVAGICCALAALCYAEFASTVPVAGSAYTFSYASLGEMIAWIIGWDLHARAAARRGHAWRSLGWSYFAVVLWRTSASSWPAALGPAAGSTCWPCCSSLC